MNSTRLISVLGWEERFLYSIEQAISSLDVSHIDLIIYKEYHKDSLDNLQKFNAICGKANVSIKQHLVVYNSPVNTWKKLQNWINKEITVTDNVLLDITTMPRETIWSLLFFLSQRTSYINYNYWSPKKYDNEWLSKEPAKPRLLFKHSGIAEFGKPTALLILTGFDYERTGQLVSYYEPKLTILGIQKGQQYDNQNRNTLEQHKLQCKGVTDVNNFELDAYSADHGFEKIKELVESLTNYNVIASSQGPKLSAISLYKVSRACNNIALTYVPTDKYNPLYSTGVKDHYFSAYN